MSKHTPGPWKKAERLNGPWWHISAESSGLGPGQGRQAVASVHGESKRGSVAYAEMFEANARLIAAAPELLEFAIELLREFPTESDLLQAGWSFTDIEGAMKVHEATCAVVMKVIGEAA